MRLLVLGVSHHTAPIDLRERLAFATPDLAEAVSTLARDPALGEVVLLSTCNRTELYATCHSLEDGHEAMAGFLTSARAVPADDLRAHIYTRSEGDAARHLFRVAAGLDSLVVGEPQILGQVKDAFATATGPIPPAPLSCFVNAWSTSAAGAAPLWCVSRCRGSRRTRDPTTRRVIARKPRLPRTPRAIRCPGFGLSSCRACSMPRHR